MKVMKKLVAFIRANKEKSVLIATGQGAWIVISWIYDNPLYIAAIAWLGPFIGGAIMTVGSLLICLGILLIYNHRGVDWLGVGVVDSVKELMLHYTEQLSAWRADSGFGRILFVLFYLPIRLLLSLARLINHKVVGEAVAFVLLSVFQDPFITTAYLRHGHYGRMKMKDWLVFFASVLLSNGYWIFRTTLVIVIAKAIWKFF